MYVKQLQYHVFYLCGLIFISPVNFTTICKKFSSKIYSGGYILTRSFIFLSISWNYKVKMLYGNSLLMFIGMVNMILYYLIILIFPDIFFKIYIAQIRKLISGKCTFRILGFGILGVGGFGILDFGKMDFGILDFGKMDVSGKRPVREKVYSGKLTSGNRSVTLKFYFLYKYCGR